MRSVLSGGEIAAPEMGAGAVRYSPHRGTGSFANVWKLSLASPWSTEKRFGHVGNAKQLRAEFGAKPRQI